MSGKIPVVWDSTGLRQPNASSLLVELDAVTSAGKLYVPYPRRSNLEANTLLSYELWQVCISATACSISIVMAIARAKVSLCWSSLFVLVLLEEPGSSDQSLLYQILDNKTRENSSFANDSSLHQLHDYLARELCDPPMEGKL